MKLNKCVKQCSMAGSWIAKALFSLVAIALLWQSSALFDTTAMAVPPAVIATTAAHQMQDAADEVRDRSKDLIRSTQQNVEKTANRNAAKVDQADENGSFVERKAQRDQARIERRADEDANRTEKAVDDSMDAVKGAIESIKEAFGG